MKKFFLICPIGIGDPSPVVTKNYKLFKHTTTGIDIKGLGSVEFYHSSGTGHKEILWQLGIEPQLYEVRWVSDSKIEVWYIWEWSPAPTFTIELN